MNFALNPFDRGKKPEKIEEIAKPDIEAMVREVHENTLSPLVLGNEMNTCLQLYATVDASAFQWERRDGCILVKDYILPMEVFKENYDELYSTELFDLELNIGAGLWGSTSKYARFYGKYPYLYPGDAIQVWIERELCYGLHSRSNTFPMIYHDDEGEPLVAFSHVEYHGIGGYYAKSKFMTSGHLGWSYDPFTEKRQEIVESLWSKYSKLRYPKPSEFTTSCVPTESFVCYRRVCLLSEFKETWDRFLEDTFVIYGDIE